MSKLRKIVRDLKFIEYTETRQGHLAEEAATITCKETPLTSFDEALQALCVVAVKVLELPIDYAENGFVVREVSFRYTKSGVGSAALTFEKHLTTTNMSHRLSTPFFRFEDHENGEKAEIHAKHVTLVHKLMAETAKYIAGDRAQGVLPIEKNDGDEETEPEDGEELDLE